MKKITANDRAYFVSAFRVADAIEAKRRAIVDALAELRNHRCSVEASFALSTATASVDVDAYRLLLGLALKWGEDLHASLEKDRQLTIAEAVWHFQKLPNTRGRHRKEVGPITLFAIRNRRSRRSGRPTAFTPDEERSELAFFLSRKAKMEADACRNVPDLRVAEKIAEDDSVVREIYPTHVRRRKFALAYAKLISRWRKRHGRPLRPRKSQMAPPK